MIIFIHFFSKARKFKLQLTRETLFQQKNNASQNTLTIVKHVRKWPKAINYS